MPVEEREMTNLVNQLNDLNKCLHLALEQQAYSNGIVTQSLKELKSDINEILVQTKMTNGRVSTLEQFKTSVKSTVTAISLAVSLVVSLVSVLLRVLL